jgi:glutaryl-CoA dehydrogenase
MSSALSKLRQAYHLFKDVDFNQLSHLSAKVDLGAVMKAVGKMDETQLQGLVKMLSASSGHKHKELPPIEGDFYHLSHTLTEEQRALQLKVRTFMETQIKPLINRYWLKGEFPFEIIPQLAELNICGVTYDGYGCPHLPFLMEGILAMEMARVDASIATFFGVQSGWPWAPSICWDRKPKSRNGFPACKSSRP